MKTDKQVYKIFAAEPRWLYALTGKKSPGKCTMIALVLKSLEQSADGVVIPDDVSEPITVVEFQFQDDPTIYARTVIEMALVQQEHAIREVRGLIFFRYPSHNPKTPPWNKVVEGYSLRGVLAAVFKPVLLTNPKTLAERAQQYYVDIRDSDIEETTKATLLAVFVSWLGQRFPKKGKQEIEKMLLGNLPDVRETQLGKDLIAIGRDEGELDAKRKVLIRQLEQRFGKLDATTKTRIRELESSRKLDSLLGQVIQVASLDQMKW